MGKLRRFVLVATTVTGALFWFSLPFGSPAGLAYPIIGLVAAIASAAVPWAPRVGSMRLSRIMLAGWIGWGVLGFAALASRDLHGVGVEVFGSMWKFIAGWLVATGVVSQLVIAGARPSDVYYGTVLTFAGAVPFLPSGSEREHHVLYGILGIAILALAPLVCAAITRAIQRRCTPAAKPELPDARVY
jgi:hypothetical protein